MLKLYNYFRSSASFRVRIALNLKNLPYEKIPIHLINHGGEQFSSEYQHINPQALVPALVDQDKILTQSLAIIEYLNEVHPTPPLLPNNPYGKSLVRAFALAIAADTHPILNLRVLKYLTGELGLSEDQKTQWYHHWMTKSLATLEKMLNTSHYTREYCFGNTPTLADICLVPHLYNARRFAVDVSLYPTITRIDALCQTENAFTQAWPDDV